MIPQDSGTRTGRSKPWYKSKKGSSTPSATTSVIVRRVFDDRGVSAVLSVPRRPTAGRAVHAVAVATECMQGRGRRLRTGSPCRGQIVMKEALAEHPEPDYLASVVYLGLCRGARPRARHSYRASSTWHNYHGQNYVEARCRTTAIRGHKAPCDRAGSVSRPVPGAPWSDVEVFARITGVRGPRRPGLAARPQHRSSGSTAAGQQASRARDVSTARDYTAVRWDLVERFCPVPVPGRYAMVPNPEHGHLRRAARTRGCSVRVVSFPLANPLPPIAPRPKDVDVCFLGGGNWHIGPQGGNRPEHAAGQATPGAHVSRASFPASSGRLTCPTDEYACVPRDVRIAVCVGGHGVGSSPTLRDGGRSRRSIGPRAHRAPSRRIPLGDGETCVLWSAGTGADPFEGAW